MAVPGADETLQGGGEMGALMRGIDWSTTLLGPVAGWPQSLRTAVSILMESRFPMYVAWGPKYVQLYNDGYRPILGSTKHPAAMGQVASDTFAESWHIIGPMFDDVRRGVPSAAEDWMLPLDRHGYLEECFFTFSYSPIRDESGGVGGVLVLVTETTGRVLGARRLRVLHALSERTALAKTPEDACAIAAAVIEGDRTDLPFALFYLLSQDGRAARLAARAGLPEGSAACVAEIDLARAEGAWPLGDVARTGQPEVIAELGERFGALPGGPWPEAARTAVVLPIARPGQEQPYGMLVVGVSPRRALDKDYRDFMSLTASHVATALTNARAFEEERRRAEQLAEIDRAKTAFFSNVSHEFRTPLTLLLGPAEDALAAADALPEIDRERWALVQRSALRLSKLVNTLLDFARIEAGRVEASYEPTALGPFTSELASMFRSAVERAGLRLVLDVEAFDEPVHVDRDMWEKIVLNLLSNALKFTFEGEIAVSLRRVDGDVELAVRDTGTGIPAAELPRVFDRFHRVKGARARTHEGTGIGLALVQELARLHGGSVAVESAEGRGTTFRVRVPRGSAHLAADRIGAAKVLASTSLGAAPYLEEALRWLPQAPAPAPAASEAAPPERGARARIVLADDNADMREYIARLLRERWDVEAVGDGVAALAAIEREPPDLVLSDVMMPGLDGFGLVKALRASPATRALPILLLSARAGEEATAEGLGAGANGYLVKPFTARDLLVRVASQLAVAKVGREARVIAEAERARLYNHFMQAPFPISVLRGAEHTFELVNEASLRVWGKTPSIVGQPIAQAMPELVGQPFLGYLDDVLRTGIAHEGKEALARLARGPDGAVEDAYFNFVYSPLRARSGEVEGVLVCGYEVTPQVLARREVERALAESARLNGEQREARRATEALLVEVSRQAQEMEIAVREMRAAKEAAEQRARDLERAQGK